MVLAIVVYRAIKAIVPWVIRAIAGIFWSMMVAASSIFVGIPPSLDRIATTWQTRAFIAGFPTEFDRPLYYTLYVFAAITVIFGWILLAYLTMGLLHLIL